MLEQRPEDWRNACMAKKKDLLPVEYVLVKQADGSVVQAEIIETIGSLVVHETLCDARLADAKSAAYSITHRATGLGLAAGVQSRKVAVTLAHDLSCAAESEGLDLDKQDLSELHDQQPNFTLFLASALELRAASRVRKGFLYSTIDALPCTRVANGFSFSTIDVLPAASERAPAQENWLPDAAHKLEALFDGMQSLGHRDKDLKCTYKFEDLGKRRGGCIRRIKGSNGSPDEYEILITTRFRHPLNILATLLHEMIHRFVGIKCGHRGSFRYVAKSLGLLSPMTCSNPSHHLCEYLMKIREPHWVGRGDISKERFMREFPVEGL
jgi:hypothetical protein